MQTSASSIHTVPAHERVFSTRMHLSLWFSLGVGLLVMQVGTYLVPALGTRQALAAIVIGSVAGAGLLAWTAKLACDSGLGSAGLMMGVYGRAFARLPIVLNILQLVGWTTFELVVMRDGTQAIVKQAVGWSAPLLWPTLFWGGILTLLTTFSMLGLVRKFVSRIGLPLVVVSLLWLTWQFGAMLHAQGVAAFWSRSGTGGMGLLAGIDLVMAMPVSWLPLVADYARHGREGRGALKGTWAGYTLANIWCYALGVLVASVTPGNTEMLAALLLAQGGLVALGLILLDELDNAYGDVYSAAVSGHSLLPRWSVRQWALAMALLCTALAMVLPMHSLEPFLLKLSSVFVPLYGVILGRLVLGGLRVLEDTRHGTAPQPVNWTTAAIWLAGIAVFHGSAAFAPAWGGSMPTLALTFLLALATRQHKNLFKVFFGVALASKSRQARRKPQSG